MIIQAHSSSGGGKSTANVSRGGSGPMSKAGQCWIIIRIGRTRPTLYCMQVFGRCGRFTLWRQLLQADISITTQEIFITADFLIIS